MDLEHIMRRLGGSGAPRVARAPNTDSQPVATQIEQPMAPSARAREAIENPDNLAAPGFEMDVLPTPHKDMTITELHELMTKYEAILDHGAYLVVWTEFKATPTASIDPITEGRRFMDQVERDDYDWWANHGNRFKFNWTTCVKQHTDGKNAAERTKKMTAAMRWMFDNDDLTPENYYWIRDNDQTHLNIIHAYAKIISAANNITQGITKGTGYQYKEFQTCSSILAMSNRIVNDFMRLIHESLRPIHNINAKIAARKFAMGTACGVEGLKKGPAVRSAEQKGLAAVVPVTREREVPKGVKRAREDVSTLEMLRAMDVTKRTRIEDIRPRAQARQDIRNRFGEDRDETPDYTPQSPTYHPPQPINGDISTETRRQLFEALQGEGLTDLQKTYVQGLTPVPRDVEAVRRVAWTKNFNGTFTIRHPVDESELTQLILNAANKAMRTGALRVRRAQRWAVGGELLERGLRTALFTENPNDDEGEEEDDEKSGDEDAQMEEGGEAQ